MKHLYPYFSNLLYSKIVLFSVCFLLLFGTHPKVIAQTQLKPVAEKIVTLQKNNVHFENVSLKMAKSIGGQHGYAATNEVKSAQFFEISNKQLEFIVSQNLDNILLTLPITATKNVTLALTKANILKDDFYMSVKKSNNKDDFEPYCKGVYYRGIVQDDPNTLAAISFFNNEVMGIISLSDGNYVFGKMESSDNIYVIYNDADIAGNLPFSCGVEDSEINNKQLNNPSIFQKSSNTDEGADSGPLSMLVCDPVVYVYFVCDYHMYQSFSNNTTSVANYVTGMFNVVSTIYANEDIETQISEIFTWTIPDPYPESSTYDALTSFRSTTGSSFNGDLAHLLSTAPYGGGVAWVNELCGSNPYAFSGSLSTFYSAFPTYSWTISVVTHEMGHNLGSQHTHWCGWTGGAIDNCGPNAGFPNQDGPCANGPTPVGGGTIMSYCHLTSVGINFNNGFGPLPGNLIRNEVNSASCLNGNPAPVNFYTTANNLSITFTCTNTGVLSYLWDFGDGEVSTIANPTHIYEAAGTYNVCLTITDNCGTRTDCQQITVDAPVSSCLGLTTLTACNGTISDGSNSSNYQNDLNCSWLIQSSTGNPITLNFTSFTTESNYDFVRIYDGFNNSSPLLGSYSGSIMPPSFISSGSSLFLEFTTNGSITYSGWSANFDCTYCGHDFLSNCNGEVSDGSGVENYQNNQYCSWYINPPGAVSITLDFTSFSLEPNYDFVYVYDSNDFPNNLLGTFTGFSLPPSITSNTGMMYIVFETDYSVTYNGWDAYYSCNYTVNYDCPSLSLNIGDPCDDGNPNTTNDVVQSNCTCAGTPISTGGGTCAEAPETNLYWSGNTDIVQIDGDAYYKRFHSFIDFNSDGLDDMLIAEGKLTDPQSTPAVLGGKLYLYRNTGTGFVFENTISGLPDFIRPYNKVKDKSRYFTDFNGDGIKDLLIECGNWYSCQNNNVLVLQGLGAAPWFNIAATLPLFTSFCSQSYALDYDNDGNKDIYIDNMPGFCSNTDKFYRNEGNFTFTLAVSATLTMRDYFCEVVNYDGGGEDLLCNKSGWADNYWGNYYWRSNNTGGFSTPITSYGSTPIDQGNSCSTGSSANSGIKPRNDSWFVLRNDPNINFVFTAENDGTNSGILYIGKWNGVDAFTFNTFGLDPNSTLIGVEDWNGDGLEDVFYTIPNGNNSDLKIAINNGSGGFNVPDMFVCDIPYPVFAVTDLDSNSNSIHVAAQSTTDDTMVIWGVNTCSPYTVTISGNTTICSGSSTTLSTATAYSTYAWSNGSTNASITINPTSNTSYSVTVTNANGCTGTANVTVVVNPNPTAGVNTPAPICAGQSASLTASGGGTYVWNTGSTAATITVSPTATTTYTVTVTGLGGCTSTASTVVTVNVCYDCPSLSLNIGDPCNDGNPNTTNDLVQSDCTCVGTIINNNCDVPSNSSTSPVCPLTSVGNPSIIYTNNTLAGISEAILYAGNIHCLAFIDSLEIFYGGQLNYYHRVMLLNENSTPITVENNQWAIGGYSSDLTLNPINNNLCLTYQYSPTQNWGFLDSYKEFDGSSFVVNENTYPTADNWGTWPRIRVGTDGVVRHTNFAHAGYNLRYFYRSSPGNWIFQILTSGFPNGSAANNQVEIDACNNYHIAYQTSSNLRYNFVSSDHNASGMVNIATGISSICDATFDNNSNFTVLFFANNDLYTVTNNDGVWGSQSAQNILTPSDIVNEKASFLYQSNGNLIVAYQTQSELFVKEKIGANWYTVYTHPGLSSSLSKPTIIDKNGTYYVVYSGNSNVYTIELGNSPILLTTPTGNICPTTTADLTSAMVTTGSTPGLNYTYFTDADCTLPLNNPDAVSVSNVYYIVGTDPNTTCSDTASVAVLINSITANLVATDATCGNADGSIDLTISGGALPYEFVWSNDGFTEDQSNLVSGSYTVTVYDGNGCQAVTTVLVNNTSAPILNSTSTDATCGNADGSIDLTISGGALPYEFVWSNDATTEDQSNLASGSYTVTVYDGNGCQSVTTVLVNDTSAPVLNSTSTDATCSNADGSIDLTITGGSSPYEFVWSNDVVTEDQTNLVSGSYTVTVYDGNGCQSVTTVLVNDTSAPVLNSVSTDATCGIADGSIDLTVSGGALPYEFVWSNDATTEDQSNLVSGSYTVTVYDNNGCQAVTTVLVNDTSAPVLNSASTDATCGNADGSIDLTVTGGAFPYEFVWSNDATTEDQSNLVSGSYAVTVYDNNGCQTVTTVTVNDTSAPVLNSTSTDATCGNADGSIDLTVTGGAFPYEFVWSNDTGTEDQSNLSSGSYTVTVYDNNGCQAVTTVVVNDISAPTLTGLAIDAACGSANGSIDLTVTGGAFPYEFVWSNDAGTEDQSNLSSGSYTVTVYDSSGCQSVTTVVVNDLSGAALSSVSTDAACGSANGSIDLTVTGGAFPYEFVWSNDAGTEDQSNLSSGSYTVTVYDSNGCQAVTTVLVNDTSAPILNSTSTDATCGNADGSIDLTVTGGAFPYEFVWSNDATTEDQSNLVSGSYTVTVYDNNGCQAVTTVAVNDTSAPVLNSTSTDATCGNADGSIDLTVTGGAFPYEFVWSNDTGTEDQSNLSSGSYTVTVIDANGCQAVTTVAVNDTSAPTLTGLAIDAACGSANGSIDLTVTGGAFPYEFVWSNDAGTEDQSNLSSGSYTVTVYDNNGCQAVTTAVVNDISAPTLTGLAIDAACGSANGSIDLTVTGGAFPYEFVWSNDAGTEDQSNLSSGSYTVTVYDSSGCQSVTTVVVNDLSGAALSSVSTDAACGSANGSIDLTVTGGAFPYEFVWSNDTGSEDQSNLSSGSYTVTVYDSSGCQSVTTVVVNDLSGAALSSVSTDAACGSANGSIDLTVTGGAFPYEFVWSNDTGSEDQSNLSSGSYTVTVYDSNGCQAVTTVVVSDISAPTLTGLAIDAACGSANGSIDLTVTGGAFPYEFVWSNDAGTEDQSNLSSGSYTVTVYDNNGCQAVTTVVVSDISAPYEFVWSTNQSFSNNDAGLRQRGKWQYRFNGYRRRISL
jgi:hypothetical protein